MHCFNRKCTEVWKELTKGNDGDFVSNSNHPKATGQDSSWAAVNAHVFGGGFLGLILFQS